MEERRLRHPCFHREAVHRSGRIHLPVAPRCNVQCNYCRRDFSCVNESRPGVTARVIDPWEAFLRVQAVHETHPEIVVCGIAGPGDPLANADETFQTFALIHEHYPDMLLCLSTNGLALPEHVDDILSHHISHVTVTVNAVDPVRTASLYAAIGTDRDDPASDPLAGPERLLRNQKAGIEQLHAHDVLLKVNTVVVPGINDTHISEIAETVSAWGADLMNCIPMIPVRNTVFAGIAEPDREMMRNIRAEAERFLPQMRHCTRCRADATGLLTGDIRYHTDHTERCAHSVVSGC